MNFSYSKNFFSKNFSSKFYNNKFSFNMFNSGTNTNRLLINFQNKLYSTNVTKLNTSDQFKSVIVPTLIKGSGIKMESNEELEIDSLIELLGSSKDYFIYFF